MPSVVNAAMAVATVVCAASGNSSQSGGSPWPLNENVGATMEASAHLRLSARRDANFSWSVAPSASSVSM